MAIFPFPPQVRVFVRDWLSANNVLLKGPEGSVLVDTGYVQLVPRTLELLEAPDALGGEPLALVVNTHCHSDHMGGNAALARRYACPVAVPEGEAPLIEAWDQMRLFLDFADQAAERFHPDRALAAGTTEIWGGLEWKLIAAPGHDMGALVFYNPEHRILISGDALWENGFGFVMPPDFEPEGLRAARATLEMIATLDVRVVIPGHGEPFTDFAPALERSMRRLAAFEADPMRLARHAPRVILAYALLHRKRLALAELPGYVERVGLHREFNHRYFHLTPEAFADWLVTELEKSGAVRREAGFLLPV
jgi:glyoxylase-like metal-dependent hydrolase (beta-lactamase superfamily II)